LQNAGSPRGKKKRKKKGAVVEGHIRKGRTASRTTYILYREEDLPKKKNGKIQRK